MTPREHALIAAGIVVLFVFSASATFLGIREGTMHLFSLLVVFAYGLGLIVGVFAWLVRIADRSEARSIREAVETEALTTSWDPRTAELATIAATARREFAIVTRLAALQVEDEPKPEPAVVKARAKRQRRIAA